MDKNSPTARILNAGYREIPAIVKEYREAAVKAAQDLRDALATADASWSRLLPVEETILILEQDEKAATRAYGAAMNRAHEAAQAVA